jgi:hypothetical protein
MAAMSIPHVPVSVLVVAMVALLALHRIYFELTTGARRRRMIKENGCEPVVWYPHKGIMGKLMGLDMIQELIQSGKQGRMLEASRLRNYANDRRTVKFKIMKNTSSSALWKDRKHWSR